MHQKALVRFHRWHHVSRVTTPLSAQSMSAVESAAWMLGYVGLPVVLSWLAPISASGWAWYMAYNVLGNIVGHANAEPIPRLPLRRHAALLSNVFVYHALHHARWNGHYSFGTAMMDRLCATEWADWPALHDRAAAGQPLRSLRERAGVVTPGLPEPDAAA
jgi:sterol desaturase/sphingolipid hydroxylase (fatty acid hydroxylase superfamily)